MKRRLIQFVTTYFLFVFIFILQKPAFMAYYHTLYDKVSWTEWFSVMWHGLPLDFSMAGYLTIIPGLLLIASAWTDSKKLQQIRRIYIIIVSILLSCIFISDLGLYGYWGFRLDTTPLFYFFSSPKDALASVSIWIVLGGIHIEQRQTPLENTFSPGKCIRRSVIGHCPIVYPHTRRIQCCNHEPRKSFFQRQSETESRSHQSLF